MTLTPARRPTAPPAGGFADHQPFRHRIVSAVHPGDDTDSAIDRTAILLSASANAEKMLARIDAEPACLPFLMDILAGNRAVASWLLRDPAALDSLMDDLAELDRLAETDEAATVAADTAGTGSAVRLPGYARRAIETLRGSLTGATRGDQASRLTATTMREQLLRIAYVQFVRGGRPSDTREAFAAVHDAIIDEALRWAGDVLQRRERRGQSSLRPVAAVLGLGEIGDRTASYRGRREYLMVLESLDRNHPAQIDAAERLVALLTAAISGTPWTIAGQTDFLWRPFGPVRGAPAFGSVAELTRWLSRSTQLDSRGDWFAARAVAGDYAVGHDALEAIRLWVHQPILTQGELAVEATLAGKLIERLKPDDSVDATAVAAAELSVRPLPECVGSRLDIDSVLRHLCLRHGWQNTTLRNPTMVTAAGRLAEAGHLSAQTATELASAAAKLQAMEDHLHIFLPAAGGVWGNASPAQQSRLAARLGITIPPADDLTDPAVGSRGDAARLRQRLLQTLDTNRQTLAEIARRGIPHRPGRTNLALQRLVLDPDADLDRWVPVLSAAGLPPRREIAEKFKQLSIESNRYLSPIRCQHNFSAAAPTVLGSIAQTEHPELTLTRLVRLTDAIGGKATLWELFLTQPAAAKLLVGLASREPDLCDRLVRHPAMFDEVIDCLAMGRLPSPATLDAQSQVLCRDQSNIVPILRSFQDCAVVRAGVHRLVNQTAQPAIAEALTATAESCIRRTLEELQERFANQFGDPVDADGHPQPLLAIAMGDFGGGRVDQSGRLCVAWTFEATGQTRRRPGGSRLTLPADQFYDRMAAAVAEQLTDSASAGSAADQPPVLPPLYQLDSPPIFGREWLRGEPATFFAMPLRRLISVIESAATGPLRDLAATARCINGPPQSRRRVDQMLAS